MHRRTSSGEEMQPDNLSMPIARARDADALQAARTQRRRAAAAAHGIFGTHKRTTCGARMQRDIAAAARVAKYARRGAKPHTTAAENNAVAARNSHEKLTGASSSSRPSP